MPIEMNAGLLLTERVEYKISNELFLDSEIRSEYIKKLFCDPMLVTEPIVV